MFLTSVLIMKKIISKRVTESESIHFLQDMTNPYIKAVSSATKRSLALGTQVVTKEAENVFNVLFFS